MANCRPFAEAVDRLLFAENELKDRLECENDPLFRKKILAELGKIREQLGKARHELYVCQHQGQLTAKKIVELVTRPFDTLTKLQGQRSVLVLCWDPHSPLYPRPTIADVQNAVFGANQSVSDYFNEVSGGLFTINNVGVLGWYDADNPVAYYDGGNPADGWQTTAHRKYFEAIRNANNNDSFPFSLYDSNFDDKLDASELAIVIAVPRNPGTGVTRPVKQCEIPDTPLKLAPYPFTGKQIEFTWVAEWMIGAPTPETVAHEIGELIGIVNDMYIDGTNDAGSYSLSCIHFRFPHFDPFVKLKCGWVTPRPIVKDGSYFLGAVQTGRTVWILMDPDNHSKSEYFIVENRQMGAAYDRNLPEYGLAIWHILEDQSDYSAIPPPPGMTQQVWDHSYGNWGRRAVRIVRPAGHWVWDGADPARQGIALDWANGAPSGFSLRSISASQATMTAIIDTPF